MVSASTNLARNQVRQRQIRTRGIPVTRFRNAIKTPTPKIWGEILPLVLRICNFFTKLYVRTSRPTFKSHFTSSHSAVKYLWSCRRYPRGLIYLTKVVGESGRQASLSLTRSTARVLPMLSLITRNPEKLELPGGRSVCHDDLLQQLCYSA